MGLFDFGKKKEVPKLDLTNIPMESKQSFNFYPRQQDYTNPFIERYNGNGYIYFGIDNLYPDVLNDLYNRSGLHSAIVDFKRNLTSGAGFEFEGEEVLKPMEKVSLRQFTDLIDGENSLQHMLNDLTLDYIIHSTVYLKVYWNSDKSKVLKVKRIEPSKLRIGVNPKDVEEIDRYYYCFDWREYGRYGMTELPKFSREKNGNKVEVYRYVNKNPTVNWYTLPQYSSGTNWMHLDAEISNYHKSNIENAINPSMALKFYKMPANEEEKREILGNIKKNFQGSSNTGRAMVFFSDDKNSAPDIEPIAVSNIDKQFNVTADQIQRNICYAHKINPAIMGLKTPGSLGNTEELDLSMEIFNKSTIQPAQKDIEQIINTILGINQLPVSFKLNEFELWTPKTDKQ